MHYLTTLPAAERLRLGPPIRMHLPHGATAGWFSGRVIDDISSGQDIGRTKSVKS